MLNSIKAKRKQLDKLKKKLDKMEDLSEQVVANRKLFRQQLSLEQLLRNDFDCLEVATKSTDIPRDNQGNLILDSKGGSQASSTPMLI